MNRSALFFILVLLILSACSGVSNPTLTATSTQSPEPIIEEPSPIPTDTDEPSSPTLTPLIIKTEEAPPTPTASIVNVNYDGLPLPMDHGDYFSGSGVCAVCHTDMQDGTGADVSIDSFWRSTMMANAARDPYWKASVLAETMDNPDLSSEIQAKCISCHMPMASFTGLTQAENGTMFQGGFLDPENNLHSLALDGVSCTLCHQIEQDGFGQDTSFSGGYVINKDLPQGDRVNYGPYEVGEVQTQIMQGVSGFIPLQGEHLQESELCATCHVLYTQTIGSPSSVLFPEQMVYFEWLNSDFASNKSCQDCHMPVAEGDVQLSITGGEPRGPFSQHMFVGGNSYILEMLKVFGDDLQVTSSSDQFDSTIRRVTDQLQNNSAEVSITQIDSPDSRITLEVEVDSSVGHKFPTGFPSRRLWLHITVKDVDKNVVFESGAWSPDGAIVGNDNDVDPSAYETHYEIIDDVEQVQIFEAILNNYEGEVTTAVLQASGYLKDNRILPEGTEKSELRPDFSVFGKAVEDDNFLGGADRVMYSIDVIDNSSPGPFYVEVELLYQPISYRWAANLDRHDGEEINHFMAFYEDVPNTPIVISSASISVSK